MNTEGNNYADPYGIAGSPADDGVIITFGTVDASHALVRLNCRNRIGEIATADLVLDSQAPVVADIDFTAEVRIGQGAPEHHVRIFTGSVVEAVTDADGLAIHCSASPSMHDPLPGAAVTRAHHLDVLYALVREAGLPDERILFQGLDELPTQIFEVVAPVEGLVVSDRIEIGPVTFVPRGEAWTAVAALGDHDLVSDFLGRPAFAVTYVTSSRQLLAEREGLRRIDASVAWTNLRVRYSSGGGPGGLGTPWTRRQLRQLAVRSDLVAVRGLATGWTWLRQHGLHSMADVPLASGGGEAAEAVLSPAVPESGLRAAAVAAARALSATDPVTRITAVWEALEFYVGSTRLQGDFSRADRKRLIRAAAAFPPEKRERVNQLVGKLNEAPLLARLRYQLAADAVPISTDDMDLLARLREQRNDLVHGRRDQPDDAELDRGVALLARIVMYASHAEATRFRSLR